MRTSLRIAVVVAVLALALVAWRELTTQTSGIPVLPSLADATTTRADEPELQAPDALADAEREAASMLPQVAGQARTPADESPAGAALLRVHVLSKEDGTPVSGRRLSLVGESDRGKFDCRPVAGSHARVGECPTTDDEGWAELEAEAEVDYSLRLLWLQAALADRNVDPLQPGEQRNMEVLVATQRAAEFYGVLVDEAQARPLSGGQVVVEKTERTLGSGRGSRPTSTPKRSVAEGRLRVGPDGRFRLEFDASERRFAAASAPGFARVVFALTAEHSDPKRPLEVQMWRAAQVEAQVRDGAGNPVVGAEVALTTESYRVAQGAPMAELYFAENPRWSAKTDEFGRARIADLPPRTSLKLSVERDVLDRHEEATPLVLDPGESRALEIVWGSGGSIRGRVVDGDGQPVAQQEIWCMVNRWGRALPVLFERHNVPAARTRTDESGRFEFNDLSLGTWCIGISPSETRLRAGLVVNLEGGNEPATLPAYAETVELQRTGEVLDMLLRVDRMLFVRGNVLRPDGDPMGPCSILGYVKNTNLHINCMSDGLGEFALGPLPRGLWTLSAGDYGTEFADSLPVDAQAGSEGVVLQLRTSSTLVGRAVDGLTLQLVPCELTLVLSDGSHTDWQMTETRTGEFRIGGLLPGNYSLSARDGAGSVGVLSPIVLEKGQVLRDLELRLVRGAKLRLRYEGQAKVVNVSILAAGVLVRSEGIERGQQSEFHVPAGAIEVRWRDSSTQTTRVQHCVIPVGELEELVWDGNP